MKKLLLLSCMLALTGLCAFGQEMASPDLGTGFAVDGTLVSNVDLDAILGGRRDQPLEDTVDGCGGGYSSWQSRDAEQGNPPREYRPKAFKENMDALFDVVDAVRDWPNRLWQKVRERNLED